MKITLNLKEKRNWLLIYSLVVVFGLAAGIAKDSIILIPTLGIVLISIWERIRINGRKIYPAWLDKLDKKMGFRPLER